ncbi:MAG: tetratricopeptide repeat protein, partial [Myxococcota bacterium]|nr:tetratricopeptide repeat protein [Myxococcota bacterium]
MIRASDQAPFPWRSIRILATVVAVMSSGCDESLFKAAHGGVEDGNEALLAGEVEAALESYEEAASRIPESPELNYDRGLALSAARRHDEATQMLLRALETRDPELRARLQAGLGAAYGRWAQDIERSEVAEAPATDQGLVDGPSGPSGPSAPTPADAALPRWERAVEHLERALTLRPDDPDVLRNLEVALLRVDPPCWARADEMEPNDVWEQAGQIELAAEEAAPQSGAQQAPAEGTQDRLTWTRQLLACPEDTDWFRVSLEPGDRLHARLTVPEGMGRLALSIHAPGASSRLRPPSSTETALEELELTPGPGRGGEYLLQVSNLDGDEVSYGLEVEVRPPCQKTEDHLEDNDDPSAPAVLTPGPVDGLKLCPGDPDWYSVTLAEGESLFVYAELQPEEEEEDEEGSEEGDVEAQPGPGLELSVRGLDGTEISRGAPAGDSRVASVLDPGE